MLVLAETGSAALGTNLLVPVLPPVDNTPILRHRDESIFSTDNMTVIALLRCQILRENDGISGSIYKRRASKTATRSAQSWPP